MNFEFANFVVLSLNYKLHHHEDTSKSYCSLLQLRLYRLIRSACVNTPLCQSFLAQGLCVLLWVYLPTQHRLSINRVYLRYHYLSHNALSLQTFFPACLLHLGLLRKCWDQSSLKGLSTEFFTFFSPSKPAGSACTTALMLMLMFSGC